VGGDLLLADELVGLLGVEVDEVDQIRGLGGGLGADLARLGLHRVGDPVLVVEQPVAQLEEPFGAAFVAKGLPGRLVGAHARDGVADLLGAGDGEGGEDRAVGGAVDVEALTRGGGAVARSIRAGAG
jgi:hypothetical protein